MSDNNVGMFFVVFTLKFILAFILYHGKGKVTNREKSSEEKLCDKLGIKY